jgi:hypothetical protein
LAADAGKNLAYRVVVTISTPDDPAHTWHHTNGAPNGYLKKTINLKIDIHLIKNYIGLK